jgi:hypothetical protein
MRLCFPLEKRTTAFCPSKTRFVAVLRFAFRIPFSIPLRYGHEWVFIRFFPGAYRPGYF